MPTRKTLLDGAKADLNVSRVILSSYEDDLSVNLAAYHLQQAVEKALKFRINMLGEKYPLTHDIEQLADILFRLGETLPEWLDAEAGNLTQYENKTRYVMGYVTSKRKLLALLGLADALIRGFEPVTVEL